MGTIIPTQQKTKTASPAFASFADSKRWISNEFYQGLNRYVTLSDGSRVTYAQQMVMSVIDMATNPEKDDYVRLAATKFITEHLEGKASVMKDETHEEIPKFAIVVGDSTAEKIKQAVDNLNPASTEEIGGYVEIEDEDGKNREDLIV